jgi:hypothetical protein
MEFNVADIKINCTQCGEKIGVLSLFDVHASVSTPSMCCMKCLPERLQKLENGGYNKETIKDIQNWLKGI